MLESGLNHLESVKNRGQSQSCGLESEQKPRALTPLIKRRPGAGKLKSCRIVHPNTLLRFAPGILRSPVSRIPWRSSFLFITCVHLHAVNLPGIAIIDPLPAKLFF